MSARALTLALTPEEAAEFRGLFYGEGHIDLIKNGRAGSLMVRLRIAVRDDDRAVLDWVRARFGGWLCPSDRTRSVCWALAGRERITFALDILASGSIPSKKRAEVALAQEALTLASVRGVHMSDQNKARLFEIRDELKRVREYRKVAA